MNAQLRERLTLFDESDQLFTARRYSELEVLLSTQPHALLLEERELGYLRCAALMYLHRTAEGFKLADDLLTVARGANDLDLIRRVHLLRGTYLGRQGRFDEAHLSLEACTAGLPGNTIDPFAAEAINGRAILLSMQGYWEEAIRELNRASAIYRQLGHTLGLGRVCHNTGVATWYLGRAELADSFFEQAANYLRSHGSPEENVSVEAERALAIADLGDEQRALAMASRAEQRARNTSSPELLGAVLSVQGTIHRVVGMYATARDFLEESLRLSGGNLLLRGEILEELGHVALRCGDLHTAQDRLREASSTYASIRAEGFRDRLVRRLPGFDVSVTP